MPNRRLSLFEKKDFSGHRLDYDAPHGGQKDKADLTSKHYPDTKKSVGKNVSSLTTGPNAWVEIFDMTQFRGNSARLPPGTQISDLSSYGFNNAIRSFRNFNFRPDDVFPQPSADYLKPGLCWVQLYGKERLSEETTLRFDAPGKIPRLSQYRMMGEQGGARVDRELWSLKVGPQAWVVLYLKDDFKGDAFYFGPNTIILDVRDYGITSKDKPDSMRIFDSEPEDWPGASPAVTPTADIFLSLQKDRIIASIGNVMGEALGLFPVLGGAMKKVQGILWPNADTTVNQVWDAINGYYSRAFPKLVRERATKDLNDKMSGIHSLLDKYTRAVEKGNIHEARSSFISLLSRLLSVEGYFKPDEDESWAVSLGFIAPYGSLYLSALREEIQHYEEIYGAPDKDSDRSDRLRRTIDDYLDAVAGAKANAVPSRVEAVSAVKASGILNDHYEIRDAVTGSRAMRFQSKSDAERFASHVREQVASSCESSLDDDLRPAYAWPYLNPGSEEAPVRTVLDTHGPFGQYSSRENAFTECHPDARITGLSMAFDDRVHWMKFSYDSARGGEYGETWGKQTLEVSLAEDEDIIAVYGGLGRLHGELTALYFRTNLGRDFGGGRLQTDGYPWVSIVPRNGGRLAGMAGLLSRKSDSTKAIQSFSPIWVAKRIGIEALPK